MDFLAPIVINFCAALICITEVIMRHLLLMYRGVFVVVPRYNENDRILSAEQKKSAACTPSLTQILFSTIALGRLLGVYNGVNNRQHLATLL